MSEPCLPCPPGPPHQAVHHAIHRGIRRGIRHWIRHHPHATASVLLACCGSAPVAVVAWPGFFPPAPAPQAAWPAAYGAGYPYGGGAIGAAYSGGAAAEVSFFSPSAVAAGQQHEQPVNISEPSSLWLLACAVAALIVMLLRVSIVSGFLVLAGLMYAGYGKLIAVVWGLIVR